MQVEWMQNLGSDDARAIKAAFDVDLNIKDCVIGKVSDLPDSAADFLSKKYAALFKPAAAKAKAKE